MNDLKFSKEDTVLEKRVTEIIRNLGIPPHLSGYHYIRYGIILSMCDDEYLSSITKSLYPDIAKKFKTTPSRVERAIRNAIEVVFKRGDLNLLNEYFGYTVDPEKGRPTNSEFIALIVDNLQLEFKSKESKS